MVLHPIASADSMVSLYWEIILKESSVVRFFISHFYIGILIAGFKNGSPWLGSAFIHGIIVSLGFSAI